MFRGSAQIQPVVDLLLSRGCSLWHACQLTDLDSYLALGGIPSRSLMEQAGTAFTSFATDPSDRAKGIWPKVFVNLSDFGKSFAYRAAAVPNPYGPIVFQIRPSALLRASDVSIALRSAGAHDFDRDAESLDSVSDVDRLFQSGPSANPLDQSAMLFGDRLRAVFAPRFPHASAAEVSLTVEPELLPLDDVVAIWVDPVEAGGESLVAIVADRIANGPASRPVCARYLREPRHDIYRDVVSFLADGGRPDLRLLAGRADVGEPTREWARSLLARDLSWQFERFGRYLSDGTLAATGRPAADLQRRAESAAPLGDSDRQSRLR
jgi:hypothetical protein